MLPWKFINHHRDHFAISTSVEEKRTRPGENILLHCDCKQLPGVYIVWYKNSSHEDTPTLVLNVKSGFDMEKKFPRFKFLKNFTFDSYDLLIVHVNNADEGLYYCGTEETKVEMDENKNRVRKTVYQFGNIITKIKLGKYFFLTPQTANSFFNFYISGADDCQTWRKHPSLL
uniref:Ig-like domain-containing protein n=1 Tax=Poecilia reticulata TaxID=8081 RepID=A0A3P9NZN6_POERE